MMKSMMFALAALAAFQAAAITATKEYVDRRDTEIRTNTYTRAETDARIAELAPTRAEVEVGFTEWVVAGLVDGESVFSPPSFVPGSTRQWFLRIMDSGGAGHIYMALSADGKNATNLVFNGDRITATRTRLPTMSDLDGKANMNDVQLSPVYGGNATRTPNQIIGYTLGDQTNSVLAATNVILTAETATNIASAVSSNAIASADTTYRRTIGVTNLNQSVQYVNITDTSPTTLAISMPTDGATKDWMVYVVSVTNVTLSLPAATWWMADTAYTNEVPPATPTAFYFSQISTNIFYLGRQELTEVAAP